MEMYKYNGVRLRGVPPWNVSVYENAIIYYVANESGVEEAHFGYSNRPFYLDTTLNLVTNTEDATIYASIYDATTKEWGEMYLFYDAAFALEPGKVLWSNVDVLDDTGEVFLEGSEPVKLFPRRWWTNLLLAGLCSRLLPVSVRNKVPVAYLYNGVRLPDINASWELISTEFGVTVEVAKSIIPYATVISNSGEYRLFLFTKLPYVDGNDCKVPNEVSIFVLDVNGNAWVFTGSQNYDYGFDVVLGEKEVLVWTNTDILDTGGSVYLAASDPVPVYE